MRGDRGSPGGLGPKSREGRYPAAVPAYRSTDWLNIGGLPRAVKARVCGSHGYARRRNRTTLRSDGQLRQEKTIALLPGGHAAGDPAGGAAARSLAVLGRPAGMEARSRAD